MFGEEVSRKIPRSLQVPKTERYTYYTRGGSNRFFSRTFEVCKPGSIFELYQIAEAVFIATVPAFQLPTFHGFRVSWQPIG
jgi:hypothetical protein